MKKNKPCKITNRANFLWVTIVVLLSSITQNLYSFDQTPYLHYPRFSKEGYDKFLKIFSDLKIVCTQPDCMPVFLGRSPTLFAAQWQATLPQRPYVHMPISGVNRITEAELISTEQTFKKVALDDSLLKLINNPASNQTTIKKLVLVDYVNDGKTIQTLTKWIFDWKSQTLKNLDIEVFTFGDAYKAEYARFFEENKIIYHHHNCSVSPRVGDFCYLMRDSLTKAHAPFDEWRPLQQKTLPVFQKQRRLHYPYRDPSNPNIGKYASFDDLVEWLKNPNLPNILPSAYKMNCDGTLFIKNIFNSDRL